MAARTNLILLSLLALGAAFQPGSVVRPASVSRGVLTQPPLTVRQGFFDAFKESMEGNYVGDDSPYAKVKAQDAAKAAAKRAKIEARKKKGFTTLDETIRKGQKTFVELKDPNKPAAKPAAKPGFTPPQLPKMPWDK